MLSFLALALSIIVGALLALNLHYTQIIWPAAAILLLGLAGHRASGSLVRSKPMLAAFLSPSSALFVLTSVAVATYASIIVSIELPGWVHSSNADLQKAVATAILAALTGALGSLWMKAAEDPDSKLWPAGAYKSAVYAAFSGDPILNAPRDAAMERLYQAAYDPKVGDDIEGWGFNARWQRAGIIKVYGLKA